MSVSCPIIYDMSTSPAVRSLAAEVRSVECGHHAFAQPDGSMRVKSDTVPDGKWYSITFIALEVGGPVQFTCEPEGVRAFVDDHQVCRAAPGNAGCLHAATVARSLERRGLVRWVRGRWVATDAAVVPVGKPCPDDPFDDLTDDDCGRALLEAM